MQGAGHGLLEQRSDDLLALADLDDRLAVVPDAEPQRFALGLGEVEHPGADVAVLPAELGQEDLGVAGLGASSRGRRR